MDRKFILPVGLLALVALGGLAGYYFINGNEHKITASGTIEATEVTISSKVVGRIKEVKMEEGSSVEKGDELVVVEDEELQASLKSAVAKYDMASQDFERSKRLYTDRMISSQQYDAAAANFQVAEAALDLAKIQLKNAVIRTPIAGIVLVKAVEPGELLTLGMPVAMVADLKEVNLRVYLSETEVGKVILGQEVSLSVDSYPKEKFSGKVIYISDRAEFTPKSIQTKEERTTQVFGVKVKIPNPALKLKPGMPADAEF